MIRIEMSGECEDCGVADLYLESEEITNYSMDCFIKEWTINCRHRNACERMYDKTREEMTE